MADPTSVTVSADYDISTSFFSSSSSGKSLIYIGEPVLSPGIGLSDIMVSRFCCFVGMYTDFVVIGNIVSFLVV